MDIDIDHYVVLGLPSGEEGAKLSEQEINKAYRAKARVLHPDKRPDDPDAHAGFLRLQTSYEVLKDEKTRKLFDDLLRVKREKLQRQYQRQGQQDSKRRKMMSDLEERERSAFAVDPTKKAREEEEMISRKLREEIDRIRAMHTNKMGGVSTPYKKNTQPNKTGGGDIGLDKDKVLKVSWEKTGVDYTAVRLTEIFEKFGPVEDVVIKGSKKKASALVVMVSKEAAVASLGNVLGDISNPLLVYPLQPASSPAIFRAERDESDGPKASNVVGAGYKAFEDSVLEKMRKAAERQKS